MRTKICGIRTEKALVSCCEMGVDYLGFNFVPNSRRLVSESVMRKAAGFNLQNKVGVFRNQSYGSVSAAAAQYGLDYLQFHGEETPEFLSKFPAVSVWKAFCLNGDFKPAVLDTYKNSCSIFLFDSAVPGSGRQGNPGLLQSAVSEARRLKMNYGVAGGINPLNLRKFEIIFPDAYLFDIASGIEINGEFSAVKLRNLISLKERINLCG